MFVGLITASDAPLFNHINRLGFSNRICPTSFTRKPLSVGATMGAGVDVGLGVDVKVGGTTLGVAADVGAAVCVGVTTFVAAAIVWVGIGVPSLAAEASQAITAKIIMAIGKKNFILVSLIILAKT